MFSYSKSAVILFWVLFPTACLAKVHQTVWIPDTCPQAKIIYEWDDTVVPTQYTLSKILSPCPAYAGLSDTKMYEAVLAENKNKNLLINHLSTVKPGEFSWNYDSERVLQVKINGIDDTKKKDFQKWSDANLGPGKAKIQ